MSDWKKIAQEAWYGWREAAEQYHRDRAGRPLIAEIEHGRLKQLRDLLKDGTSLSRAYHEINTRRDGGAPQPTVEALMYSLRERGIKALEEVATKRRLSLLNEAQLRAVCQRVQNFKPEIALRGHPRKSRRSVSFGVNCNDQSN